MQRWRLNTSFNSKEREVVSCVTTTNNEEFKAMKDKIRILKQANSTLARLANEQPEVRSSADLSKMVVQGEKGK